jgi:hypothetical protein
MNILLLCSNIFQNPFKLGLLQRNDEKFAQTRHLNQMELAIIPTSSQKSS